MAEKTHWKKMTNPDYIGVYALEEGKDLIGTIKSVTREQVKGEGGKSEECTVVYFVEKNIKPLVCNATNAKTISKIYETPYVEEWAGKKIQLFASTAKLKGETVEALRIRPFIPNVTAQKTEKVEHCTECKEVVEGYGSKNATQIAQHTLKNYKRILCYKCATKLAEAKANNSEQDKAEQTDREQSETVETTITEVVS